MENVDLFLKPTSIIDCDHPAIVRTVEDLTRECITTGDKAVQLFYYVRDKCHYNMYDISDDRKSYRSSWILEKGQGWCMPKAILFTSLCRAAGIPSRLILTSICNHKSPPEAVEMMGTNVFFPHVYNHIYINGHWIKAAPTFNYDICKRIGVSAVEFDGVHDAVLPQLDLEGGLYIEYLDDYGVFADVPWTLIFEIGYKIYGDSMRRWFPK